MRAAFKRGNENLCRRCDAVTACKRRGILFYCPRCFTVNEIAHAAQCSKFLIIKNGEYWDFKHEEFADFIDSKIRELEARP